MVASTLTVTMKTYTKREIAHLANVSVRTIADDIKFLGLKHTEGDRGLKLFNEYDFNLICQLREHCADKSNSRESFVPNTEVEIINDEPRVSKLEVKGKREEVRGLSLYEESISFGLAQDPLFDLELLQRISDRSYLLPATRLAPILGITANYLNRQKDYCYCGFTCSKETRAGGRALWKVQANNS